MRGWLAASAAAGLVLIACSEQDASQATAPDAPGAPALSVYSLGTITSAVPHPCPAAGSRQFDFWVGQWDVIGKTGAHAATSIISSEMDDCLVMEDYVQDNGVYNGRSLSVYDPTPATGIRPSSTTSSRGVTAWRERSPAARWS
jgi:hypothetical protein